MIDRVEVVRGGGSALFGASAIGGTINIITKEAMRSGAGISHELTSIGMSGALDNNTSVNASMVTDDGRGGLSVIRAGDAQGMAMMLTATGLRRFLHLIDNYRYTGTPGD